MITPFPIDFPSGNGLPNQPVKPKKRAHARTRKIRPDTNQTAAAIVAAATGLGYPTGVVDALLKRIAARRAAAL